MRKASFHPKSGVRRPSSTLLVACGRGVFHLPSQRGTRRSRSGPYQRATRGTSGMSAPPLFVERVGIGWCRGDSCTDRVACPRTWPNELSICTSSRMECELECAWNRPTCAGYSYTVNTGSMANGGCVNTTSAHCIIHLGFGEATTTRYAGPALDYECYGSRPAPPSLPAPPIVPPTPPVPPSPPSLPVPPRVPPSPPPVPAPPLLPPGVVDSEPGLRAAIDEAYLSGSLTVYIPERTTIFLSNEIQLPNNFTLVMESHGFGAMLSGRSQTRHFSVGLGRLILRRVHLMDGWAEKGGAILLHSAGASLLIQSAFIHYCYAKYAGGAVCGDALTSGVTIQLKDVQLAYCGAAYGGGILVASGASLLFDGGSMSRCRATRNGGGIAGYSPGTTIKMRNVHISEAQAMEQGGAVIIEAIDTLEVHDCTIVSCSAVSWGGAIFAFRSVRGFLTGTTILQCSGGAVGGALYLSSRLPAAPPSFVLDRCAIVRCNAQRGGFAKVDQGASLVLKSTEVRECSADEGGALYMVLSFATMTQSSLIGCQANLLGSSVYQDQSKLVLRNATLVCAQLRQPSAVLVACVHQSEDLFSIVDARLLELHAPPQASCYELLSRPLMQLRAPAAAIASDDENLFAALTVRTPGCNSMQLAALGASHSRRLELLHVALLTSQPLYDCGASAHVLCAEAATCIELPIFADLPTLGAAVLPSCSCQDGAYTSPIAELPVVSPYQKLGCVTPTYATKCEFIETDQDIADRLFITVFKRGSHDTSDSMLPIWVTITMNSLSTDPLAPMPTWKLLHETLPSWMPSELQSSQGFINASIVRVPFTISVIGLRDSASLYEANVSIRVDAQLTRTFPLIFKIHLATQVSHYVWAMEAADGHCKEDTATSLMAWDNASRLMVNTSSLVVGHSYKLIFCTCDFESLPLARPLQANSIYVDIVYQNSVATRNGTRLAQASEYRLKYLYGCYYELGLKLFKHGQWNVRMLVDGLLDLERGSRVVLIAACDPNLGEIPWHEGSCVCPANQTRDNEQSHCIDCAFGTEKSSPGNGACTVVVYGYIKSLEQDLAANQAAQRGSSTVLMAWLIPTCTASLLLLLCYFLRRRRILGAVYFQLRETNTKPELALSASHKYHTFLSHTWKSGQDQVAVIKHQLKQFMPGIRVFLDVDDLIDISKLEEYINQSQSVLIFLSKGYFLSKNCLREVVESSKAGKYIILVHEADSAKGGASLDELRNDCPADLQTSVFGPVGTERPIIQWHRATQFQLASLLRVGRLVLTASPKPPSSALFVKTAVTEDAVGLTDPVTLLISQNNPGALERVQELLAETTTSKREPSSSSCKQQSTSKDGQTLSWIYKSTRKEKASLASIELTTDPTSLFADPQQMTTRKRLLLKKACQALRGVEGATMSKAAQELQTRKRAATRRRQSTSKHLVYSSYPPMDSTITPPASPPPSLSNELQLSSAEPSAAPSAAASAVKVPASSGSLRVRNAWRDAARRTDIDELSHVSRGASPHSDKPMNPATHVCLYLNHNTFVSDQHGEALANDIRAAQAAKLPLLLLHENSPAHGGCEFARFFHSTPDDLIDSGLFNDIAVALYTSEEELAVSRAFVKMALRGKGDDPFDVKQTTSALMRRGLRKLCYSWSNGSTQHPGVMTRLRARVFSWSGEDRGGLWV